MKLPANRPLPWLGAVLALGFIIALATKSVEAIQDERSVAELTGQMKPVCVGRLLIDLPEGARHELSQPRIDGFNIATFDETPAAFKARVDERLAQIIRTPAKPGQGSNLELARAVKNRHGVAGQVFVHGRTVAPAQSSKGANPKRLRPEAVVIEALVHGNGVSVDFTAELADPDAVGQLSTLIARLVPNPKNVLPFESGFCMDKAYIRGPQAPGPDEQIVLAATLSGRPEIAFTLLHSGGTGADRSGLLNRSTGLNARTASDAGAPVSIVLARLRSIGGLAGAEVVEQYGEKNHAAVYRFWWEANGSKDKLPVPRVALTMFTGGGAQGTVLPALSQGIAYGLWDKVATTVRLHANDNANDSTKDKIARRPQADSNSSALARAACTGSGSSPCAAPSSRS